MTLKTGHSGDVHATSSTNSSLVDDIFERIAESELADDVGQLVLAACLGDVELADVLAGRRAGRQQPEASADIEPSGAYLRSIGVAGFRGIGPEQTLRLQPGPGLTLVMGRNGSGKSSFAEAAELVLTGTSFRWSDRSSIWRQGWRNLHSGDPCRISIELAVDGQNGATKVIQAWQPSDSLEGGRVTVQRPGRPQEPLSALGWAKSVETYRPFLSYAELRQLITGRPTEMYDALQAILGVERLVEADRRLGATRKDFDDEAKKVKLQLGTLRADLARSGDARAKDAVALLDAKSPDLEALTDLCAGTVVDGADPQRAVLRTVEFLSLVEAEAVDQAIDELREAVERFTRVEGTDAATARRVSGLLDTALDHQHAIGVGPCPVCGGRVLDDDWRRTAITERDRLRQAATQATAAIDRRDRAVQAARALINALPAGIETGDVPGLDLGQVRAAWKSWTDLPAHSDVVGLAEHLATRHRPLLDAVAAAKESARAELAQRDATWQPLALQVAGWVESARRVSADSALVARLKKAREWLREATQNIREDRMRPIATQCQRVWSTLRQESNVELGPIQLTGSANMRRVALDVTVDGVAGAALGVMSQGELHALGLSLFLPRAAARGSPFRFIVIDDPVQAMDPSKVDGLAQILAIVSKTHQVLVFTHDDRLSESVRRQQIETTMWEVVRRELSVVELRKCDDPVKRYLDDARALAATDLGADVKAAVIAGFCRSAVEAACHERVRRLRLGRGERHADVEDALAAAQTLNQVTALALFDDMGRGAEVMTRLNNYGRWAGDAFKAIKNGVHGTSYDVDLHALVTDSARVAEQIRS